MLQEGVLTGIVGALILLAWYIASDAVNARLLHTPNVLGQLVFAADTTPTVRQIVPGAVAGYTALHVAVFLAAGVLLTWLHHLALRHPAWRSGVLIGLVVGVGMVEVFLFMAPPIAGDAALRWSVAFGSIVAALAMGIYLWHRHPEFGRAVHDTPLGSEVESPPHPPGPPRV
jgi:hypothetical protein